VLLGKRELVLDVCVLYKNRPLQSLKVDGLLDSTFISRVDVAGLERRMTDAAVPESV